MPFKGICGNLCSLYNDSRGSPCRPVLLATEPLLLWKAVCNRFRQIACNAHIQCMRLTVQGMRDKNDGPGENSGAVLSRCLVRHGNARQRAEGL
mgnify:CR=1 FL=1